MMDIEFGSKMLTFISRNESIHFFETILEHALAGLNGKLNSSKKSFSGENP